MVSLIFWTQPISSNRLSNGLTLENLTVYQIAKDNVNVSFTSEDVKDWQIKLFNNMGELLYFTNKAKIVGEFTKQIELLSNYSKGSISLKITLGGEEFSRKVIVQKR